MTMANFCFAFSFILFQTLACFYSKDFFLVPLTVSRNHDANERRSLLWSLQLDLLTYKAQDFCTPREGTLWVMGGTEAQDATEIGGGTEKGNVSSVTVQSLHCYSMWLPLESLREVMPGVELNLLMVIPTSRQARPFRQLIYSTYCIFCLTKPLLINISLHLIHTARLENEIEFCPSSCCKM